MFHWKFIWKAHFDLLLNFPHPIKKEETDVDNDYIYTEYLPHCYQIS